MFLQIKNKEKRNYFDNSSFFALLVICKLHKFQKFIKITKLFFSCNKVLKFVL